MQPIRRVDQDRENYYARQLDNMRELLTPHERDVAARARRALFLTDVMDADGNMRQPGAVTLYLSLHPPTPEEGLSLAEQHVERDAFDRDEDELVDLLRHRPDYADPPLADSGSAAEPGTNEKIGVMFRRQRAKRSIFHPDDLRRDPTARVAADGESGPNGRKHRLDLRLVGVEDDEGDDGDGGDVFDPLAELRASAAASLRRIRGEAA